VVCDGRPLVPVRFCPWIAFFRVRSEEQPSESAVTPEVCLAERVGFVPAILPPLNDLGLIRSPQSTKSTQSLSIRYKTGTAKSIRARLGRRLSTRHDETWRDVHRGHRLLPLGSRPPDRIERNPQTDYRSQLES